MPKRITTEEYNQWLSDNRPDVKCLGDYKNSRTKTDHQCVDCHYVWQVRPNQIKNQARDARSVQILVSIQQRKVVSTFYRIAF